jgi:hypothetical protein
MALSPELKKMVSGAKNKYSGGSGKTIKPKEGRNTYRILAPTSAQAPWVPASGQYWADLGVHWIKADVNSNKPLVVCGDCDTVYQQPSVLNTAIEMAINSAIDEESKKLYEDWKASKSVIVNVIDRSLGEDPQVLELTPTTFGKVMDLINIYDDAGQDITSPLTGTDIIVTKTGKGLNTKYDVAVSPAPSAPLSADVLGRVTDLHAFIAQNYFRGEEQKALNAIAQIAGVAVPALTGPSGAAGVRTPTAALASPSATVAGAQVAAAVATAPAAVAAAAVAPAAAVAAAPAAEDPAIAARRAEILRRQQEAEAELAALSQPAVEPAAAAAPAAGISSLPVSEQDAILAELDNLV